MRGKATVFMGAWAAIAATSPAWAQDAVPEQPGSLPPSVVGRDGQPLSGYHGGSFYLRDATNNFQLIPMGMVGIDTTMWRGSGVTELPGQPLSPQLTVRAARFGVQLRVLEAISARLEYAADFQPISNPQGQQQISAAPAGTVPTVDSPSYAPAQVNENRASILHGWVNLSAGPALNVLLGQYWVPFGMDHNTGLGQLQFHERALAMRAIGGQMPFDLGATAWGDIEAAGVSYQVGVFQGDGINRPGVDRRRDVALRARWQPLRHLSGSVSQLRVGASTRLGRRQADFVNYDAQTLSTQLGYGFWVPHYNDAQGRLVRVIPADDQRAAGFEAYVPLGALELRSEVLFANQETREAIDGYVATNTERTGRIKGYGGYVSASYTLWGTPGLNGIPGQGTRPRNLNFKRFDPLVPKQQVEALVRLEALALNYEGAARAGTPDPDGGLDGDITVYGTTLGVNYWASQHARLSFNYSAYLMPDGGTADNRARTPADLVADDGNGSALLHELGLRFATQF